MAENLNGGSQRVESAIGKAQFSDPYIPAKLEFNVRFFADDTSLFSLVHDSNDSSTRLGRDLGRVAGWAHQWKMSCNPDPSKQAVEVYFSRKINPVDTSPVYFNNLTAASCETLHIQPYCQIKGWPLISMLKKQS